MLRQTDERDEDQVVLRWSRRMRRSRLRDEPPTVWEPEDKTDDDYIVMVDQLWLWIFGGGLVVRILN